MNYNDVDYHDDHHHCFNLVKVWQLIISKDIETELFNELLER
jgi:hypothetical protein